MRIKIKVYILIIAFLVVINYSDAKGGRGGGSRGSFSRGSSSRGSSSWFGSSSKTLPSHSSHSSPSYTHNSPSSSYGWNVGSSNTGSKHYGPPPSYPGLQNRPVPSNNAPPGYSPYRPTYTYPSNNFRQLKSYETNNHFYGNTFGRQGLAGNTYISNNYYGSHRSSDSGFLTNAMFYGVGMHHGNSWGRSGYYNHHHTRRTWSEDEDRKWRETTRAPYFENKVPGEEKILPASAVIGVATAFGLASLLPLNVPANKPLMYCTNTELMQSHIKINNEYVYQCINGSIVMSCIKDSTDSNTHEFKKDQMQVNQARIIDNLAETDGNNTDDLTNLHFINETEKGQLEFSANQKGVLNNTKNLNQTEQLVNQTPLENQTNFTMNQTNALRIQTDQDCSSKIMVCNLPDEEMSSNIYCKDDTLLSKSTIFCNSTSLLNETIQVNGTDVNTTITILNCFDGLIPEKQASFIPIRTTTQKPTTTTERSLSYSARAHLFLLKLLGKYDVTDIKSTTPNAILPDNETWIPEALTIPPVTTTIKTTTTEAPFEWMEETFTVYENGNWGVTLAPISKTLIDIIERSNDYMTKRGDRTGVTYPLYWKKVYVTKSMETTTFTSFTSNNTTISEKFTTTVSTNDTISSTTKESIDEYESDEYDD